MTTLIVDYGSGNLHSALKSFQRMAQETGEEVQVSSDAEEVARADRLVLPGVGAFADCRAGLAATSGLYEAMEVAVLQRGRPFLGICVGMQMMARHGLEHGVETAGFGWFPGEVIDIRPTDKSLKIPHMGWNDLVIDQAHPVLEGLKTGDHAYFVHSYHMALDTAETRLAHVEYGGAITAMVGRDNIVGTQFHPEKSQSTGLRLIGNFLAWKP